jgi:biopolymer transport protein ExbD
MHTVPTRVRAEPNVTPMIDVMLVLLIIFMTVGPLLGAGFQAVPPQGTHLAAHPEESSDAVIGLDGAGRYYFNKERVTEEALVALLAEGFHTHGGDRVVYVRADKDLTYGRVHAAMELAASAGARVIGLVSEQPPVSTRPDVARP